MRRHGQCYAFLAANQSQRNELLEDHLKAVYNCIEKLDATKRITRKYAKLVNDSSEEPYISFVSVAGLLHDVGKGFEYYQSEGKYHCHEFPTASLIEKHILKELASRGSANATTKIIEIVRSFPLVDESTPSITGYDYASLMILVTMPILIHHYAQHSSDFWNKICSKRSITQVVHGKLLSSKYSECCKDTVETIKNIIEESMLNDVVKSILANSLNELISGNEYEVVTNLNGPSIALLCDDLRRYTASRPYVGIVLAVTGVLNYCDGKIAMLNRSKAL